MLGHLVDHAKLRLSIAATHYGGRMLALASFAVAALFAIAAIFIVIAERAGPVAACVTMAVAFLLLAIVLGLIMGSRERTQRLAMRQAQNNSAMAAGLASVVPAVLASGRRAIKGTHLSSPLVLDPF